MHGLRSTRSELGHALEAFDAFEHASHNQARASAGTRVGRYDVLGRVAVGGMSEIFLAYEQLAGEPVRRVAIKLLRPAANGAGLARAEALFAREGRTLLRLDHPNICHSHEFGQLGQRFFIAMEWVDGVSLRELMLALRARGETLPLAHAVNLIAQVAAGLQHAHTACDARNQPLAVVHRDVNPTNIMIRYDGVVKLIDFGVAQASEASHAAIAEQIEGKLGYMAPEQVRGEALDARADIFALGVCLFEIAAGTRLYRRKQPEQVRTAILLGEVPSASAINPAVPAELDAIIQLTLQKEPGARFQNACALQAALEDFLVDNNLPMGARSLATLMEPLYSDRPLEPSVEPSEELHLLIQQATETRVRELRSAALAGIGPGSFADPLALSSGLHGRPPALAAHAEPRPLIETLSWLSPAHDERSGARAVVARRSDHGELAPARARFRWTPLHGAMAVGVLVGAGLALLPSSRGAQATQASALAMSQAAGQPPADLRPRASHGVRTEPSGSTTAQALPTELASAAPSSLPPAGAQPVGDRMLLRARALFQEGVEHNARMEYKAAARCFQLANAIRPAPTITFNWALALFGLTHFAEAYQRLASLQLAPNLPAEVAQRVAVLEETLRARITRLTVELPPDGADLQLHIDRLPVLHPSASVSRALTPGRHELQVRRAGQLLLQRVVHARAGEQVRVSLASELVALAANPYAADSP